MRGGMLEHAWQIPPAFSQTVELNACRRRPPTSGLAQNIILCRVSRRWRWAHAATRM